MKELTAPELVLMLAKAEGERDTARARLAEVERERDEARDTRDVTHGMLLQAREAGDAARAQVKTLAEALRGIAKESASEAERIIARAALKAARVEP